MPGDLAANGFPGQLPATRLKILFPNRLSPSSTPPFWSGAESCGQVRREYVGVQLTNNAQVSRPKFGRSRMEVGPDSSRD